MSLAASKRVWANAKATGSALVLLLALADHANDDLRAWPSVPTLARLAKLTDRQVRNLLHALVESGELSVAGSGPRGVVIYRIACRPPETGFTPEAPFTPPPEADFREQTATPEADFRSPLKPASPKPLLNQVSKKDTVVSLPRVKVDGGPPTPKKADQKLGKLTATAETERAFSEFWRHYPNRGAHGNPRKPASERFAAALKRGIDPAAIIRGAENYASAVSNERTDPRYIAQATTWLTQERWADLQSKPAPTRQDDGWC